MKKVRMIVSAVAVFAVVGSALAFSPKGTGSLFCQDGTTQACVAKNYNVQPTSQTQLQCTAVSASNCINRIGLTTQNVVAVE